MALAVRRWLSAVCAELFELGSALTQFLNALTGGGTDLSFSARSAELAERGAVLGHVRVAVVNTLFLLVEWRWGHCQRNLAEYRERRPA